MLTNGFHKFTATIQQIFDLHNYLENYFFRN